MGSYLERMVSRFEDNTASVRRSAIQAFGAVLQQHLLIDQLRNLSQLEQQVEMASDAEKVPLKLMLQDCKKLHALVQRGSKVCLR